MSSGVVVMDAVSWLVLLIGLLSGALTGAAVCFRTLRAEMLGRVGPQLNVVELKVDNLRNELDLVAQRQDALRREL